MGHAVCSCSFSCLAPIFPFASNVDSISIKTALIDVISCVCVCVRVCVCVCVCGSVALSNTNYHGVR